MIFLLLSSLKGKPPIRLLFAASNSLSVGPLSMKSLTVTFTKFNADRFDLLMFGARPEKGHFRGKA